MKIFFFKSEKNIVLLVFPSSGCIFKFKNHCSGVRLLNTRPEAPYLRAATRLHALFRLKEKA